MNIMSVLSAIASSKIFSDEELQYDYLIARTEVFDEVASFVLVFSIVLIAEVLDYLRKRNETNKRTQILLTAIEKNEGMLPQDLLTNLNKPKKSIKERLLGKLMWGILLGGAGLGVIITAIVCMCRNSVVCGELLVVGVVLLAAGIAFLVYYFIGRRELRNEIEAEERQLTK